MNDIEVRRLENIQRNKDTLKGTRNTVHPEIATRDQTKTPPAKKRKLEQPALPPSRSSARIASAPARPSYNKDEKDEAGVPVKKALKPAARKSKEPIVKAEEIAEVPAKDIESRGAGWTAWEATAPPPTRDDESTFHFEDQPTSTPNRSPEEMMREGCFGGSHWRSLYSRRLGTTVADDWQELPESWISGLDVGKFLTSPSYDPGVNKYKVSSGQTI